MSNVNSSSRAPAPVSAIFFDLDNTLIETRLADKRACNKVLFV